MGGFWALPTDGTDPGTGHGCASRPEHPRAGPAQRTHTMMVPLIELMTKGIEDELQSRAQRSSPRRNTAARRTGPNGARWGHARPLGTRPAGQSGRRPGRRGA